MRKINFSLLLIAKNVVAVIFSFLLLSTLIISCKKDNLVTEETKQPSFENLIPKIKSWIDGQKNGLPTASVAKIESLESNLSYSEIRLEKYKESKELIVIPILSGFKSANNSDKDPANYLVLVLKNQDSITNGNIIQYVSSSSQRTPPNNTFFKIFTYQNIDCSGRFTMLNLSDDFQYELNFENEKLFSLTDMRKRNHQNNEGTVRINEDCIDWYLQIWLIWWDGSMTLESETYVYTTCDGDCAQPRIANGRSYRMNCNGGGGGGGGYNVEYDYGLTADRTWNSYQNPNTPSMYIWHWDQYWGRRQAGNPSGGYFTKITKLDRGSQGFPSYMSVIYTSDHAWNYTNTAHHEVQGYLTSQIAPPEYFTKNNIVQFSELW